MLAVFGRYSTARLARAEERRLRFLPPAEVPLTPAQRSTAWYFFAVAALFLLQNLLGGATAHYQAETGGFFGIDLPQWLPYNLTRTWHLQLALFFVAAAYLAAGIFLAPLIAGREPRGQGFLSFLLLGAVVGGGGRQHGRRGRQLQGLAAAARPGRCSGRRAGSISTSACSGSPAGRRLVLWCVILFRGLRARLATESRGNLPYLFFYSALSIPLFYAVGPASTGRTPTSPSPTSGDSGWSTCGSRTSSNCSPPSWWPTSSCCWAWSRRGPRPGSSTSTPCCTPSAAWSAPCTTCTSAARPAIHMALGAFFSAAEVIPLTFLTVEAWTFLHLGDGRRWAAANARSRTAGRCCSWPRSASGTSWGRRVRLPHQPAGGQLLRDRHATDGQPRPRRHDGRLRHAGHGLLVFCLRYLLRPEDWSERLVGFSFWALNLGLAWMVFANLFPIGVLQLGDAVANGYWHARSEFFRQAPYRVAAAAGRRGVHRRAWSRCVCLTARGRIPARATPRPGGPAGVRSRRRCSPRSAGRARGRS